MIKTIWNVQGIEVMLTGIDSNHDPAFVGIVQNHNTPTKGVMTWTAWPTSNGYRIEIRTRTNLIDCLVEHTPTYNLGLEVASQAKR